MSAGAWVGTGLLALCSACGDPLLATVGVLDALDGNVGATMDGSVARVDAAPSDGTLEEPDSAPAVPTGWGNCVVLPNLGGARAVDDAGLLDTFVENGVRVGTAGYYRCADAGNLPDQLFSFTSGQPIIKAGVRYALRPEGVGLSTWLRTSNDACERPALPQIPEVLLTPCYEFSVPQSALYVRIAGGLAYVPENLTMVKPVVRICDKGCP